MDEPKFNPQRTQARVDEFTHVAWTTADRTDNSPNVEERRMKGHGKQANEGQEEDK